MKQSKQQRKPFPQIQTSKTSNNILHIKQDTKSLSLPKLEKLGSQDSSITAHTQFKQIYQKQFELKQLESPFDQINRKLQYTITKIKNAQRQAKLYESQIAEHKKSREIQRKKLAKQKAQLAKKKKILLKIEEKLKQQISHQQEMSLIDQKSAIEQQLEFHFNQISELTLCVEYLDKLAKDKYLALKQLGQYIGQQTIMKIKHFYPVNKTGNNLC